ncbi:uncharacterized protein BDV14DRAFT_95822 [Aspergillus stella-maris]|uniref:uncharacterized protein n=1 Tax=Aspergillus stella-maris TaxID=1810926 RepID=UPI003CCE4B82
MRLPALSLLSAFALTTATTTATASTVIVPDHAVNAPSNAQFISNHTAFDGPKVFPINASTWDWWYFDAVQVSPDTNSTDQASVVATFYTALPSAFEPLALYAARGFTSLSLGEIVVTWPNGTRNVFLFNSTEARITTVGDGAVGVWESPEGDASFRGSEDMRIYEVTLESEIVSGRIVLQAIAPPHYPCGPAEAAQGMQLAPGIGWANAVPDAISDVHLTVYGQNLDFTGIGYHDKNWGNVNFAQHVGTWYWGHGRVGPYSLVWFDYVSPKPEQNNRVAVYVSRGGEILTSQCSGVTVRPFGDNSTYPPLMSTGAPTGFNISVEIPGADDMEFAAMAKYVVAGSSMVGYVRWTGSLEVEVDGERMVGETLYEQFAFERE